VAIIVRRMQFLPSVGRFASDEVIVILELIVRNVYRHLLMDWVSLVVLGTGTGTQVVLKYIFRVLVLVLYLHAKYWYLYWYLNLQYWYWYL